MAYLYEMHMHTSDTSPCGWVSAEEGVTMYRLKGYSGVVVTDHYCSDVFNPIAHLSHDEQMDRFLAGYRHARKAVKGWDFDVLLGVEYRNMESYNDYLVYGLEEDFFYREKDLMNRPIDQVFNLFHDNNAIIFQAHPYRPYVSNLDHPDLIDGIERHNGNARQNYDVKKTVRALRTRNLRAIASSDFHIEEDLANGGIVFGERISSEGALVQALRDEAITALLIDKLEGVYASGREDHPPFISYKAAYEWDG